MEQDQNQAADLGELKPVAKSVTVAMGGAEAFAAFAERPMQWWPAHHKLVPGRRTEVVFEPHVGGRWFERDADGQERDWGRVVDWSAPDSLVLTWQIDGRWQPVDDPATASEVAVTFTPRGAATEVELVHRALERHGADGPTIRRALDGPSPGDTLAGYAAVVDQILREGVQAQA